MKILKSKLSYNRGLLVQGLSKKAMKRCYTDKGWIIVSFSYARIHYCSYLHVEVSSQFGDPVHRMLGNQVGLTGKLKGSASYLFVANLNPLIVEPSAVNFRVMEYGNR